MTDSSLWGTSMLTEYLPAAQESLNKHMNLLAMFEEELQKEYREREAKDKAYLASLSPVQRKRVLTLRKIDAVERRYRQWWEDNVAWRFGSRPECWDD